MEKKHKIGFNLLPWSSTLSPALNPVADRLKEIGYDGVECFMGEGSEQSYIDFGKRLKDCGLESTCVLGLGPEHDPISESPAVRSKAVEKLKWAVDRASDLGARLICGPVHSAFTNFRLRPPSEDEFKWSAETLHIAGEYAATSQVVFAVEALNRFECYLCNTAEQLLKLTALADHPNIRVMFDTHHANIEEKKYAPAIIALKDKLAHVHISENDRGTPGDGHVQWEETFSTLSQIGYEGWLTIEAFSRNDEGFANSINVWRTFSPTWEIAAKGFRFTEKMKQKYLEG